MEVLQETVSDENTVRKDVEEEMMKLKSLATASDELSARLAEYDKALEAARA